MAKSIESIVIDVPIDKFHKVISDYESLPKFIPELKTVKIESFDGHEAVVTYTVSLIKKVTYTLRQKHTVTPEHREVSWNLVKGEIMKSNTGRWFLEPNGSTSTKATYEIEMTFPLLVPGSVISSLQSKNLPKLLAQFKERAEALYRQGAL